MNRTFGAALLLSAAVHTYAQAPVITETELLPLAKAAIAVGAGNPGKTIDALDKSVKEKWGDFNKRPIDLSIWPSHDAYAAGPYLTFRYSLDNRIRKFEATDDIPFAEDEATISIFPKTIDSPDFVKVVVQRNGAMVDPLRSTLAPQEFTNGLGNTVIRHSGDVIFPLAAFAPGAEVVVTLVPSEGRNDAYKLRPQDLLKFR